MYGQPAAPGPFAPGQPQGVQVGQPPAAADPPQAQSFLGRMVDAVSHPRRSFDSISNVASAYIKDLVDYTVDTLDSAAIVAKYTFKYAAYGSAIGLVSGAYLSCYQPELSLTIFPFAVGAGATAGAIYGFIKGSAKASDHFNALQANREMARKQREEQDSGIKTAHTYRPPAYNPQHAPPEATHRTWHGTIETNQADSRSAKNPQNANSDRTPLSVPS